MHDLLGFYPNFRPWFAKCYVPQVIDKYKEIINQQSDLKKFGIDTKEDGLNYLVCASIQEYIQETKSKTFPSDEYTYPIKSIELENIMKSKMWKL